MGHDNDVVECRLWYWLCPFITEQGWKIICLVGMTNSWLSHIILHITNLLHTAIIWFYVIITTMKFMYHAHQGLLFCCSCCWVLLPYLPLFPTEGAWATVDTFQKVMTGLKMLFFSVYVHIFLVILQNRLFSIKSSGLMWLLGSVLAIAWMRSRRNFGMCLRTILPVDGSIKLLNMTNPSKILWIQSQGWHLQISTPWSSK